GRLHELPVWRQRPLRWPDRDNAAAATSNSNVSSHVATGEDCDRTTGGPTRAISSQRAEWSLHGPRPCQPDAERGGGDLVGQSAPPDVRDTRRRPRATADQPGRLSGRVLADDSPAPPTPDDPAGLC